MCRLFGFRSSLPDAVHHSLVRERNSLRHQSREHKDGWGIASYGSAEAPVVAHGLGAAHADPDFERVSSLVTSQTVLAHVRLASVGAVEKVNAHPFVHGPWAFAHNGTLRDFERHQASIEALISRRFLTELQGTTDSERCFYLFLTNLEARSGRAVQDVARALVATMNQVAAVTDGAERSSMNFLATDGYVMVATRRNRTLFFAELKRRGAPSLEPPPSGTRLEQIVVASEELSGEDHWHEVPEEGVVAVDAALVLHRWSVAELS